MMGHRQVEQAALFYEFSLEDTFQLIICLRSIDRFVEFGEVRRELAAFYSTMGRPSIDPELMIRMLIVGLLLRHSIRAAAVRGSPPQSGISMVLSAWARRACPRSFDLLEEPAWPLPRERSAAASVRDSPTALHSRGAGWRGSLCGRCQFDQGGCESAERHRRREGAATEATGRAVEEYLAVLDDAAFGAATDVVPKFVSPADPAARWTGAHGGQAFFAYSTNYLIDADNAIIVDVEATTAIRQAEVLAAKRMIERSMARFDLYPARLLGDSAYGSAEMLGWLVYEQGIEPHVTVFDKSARQDGTFSRDDFTYDHAGDVYYCPGGKMLTTTGSRINDGATLRYRASKYDCEACRLKPRCCPKEPARYVPRSIYEGARDMARQIASSWEGRTARRLRKKVEMLFAHLKRILRLDRLRLRGPNGAHDEFLLAATAQNLRKLAKLIPTPSLQPA